MRRISDRPDNCLSFTDVEELNMDALMAAAASGIQARIQNLDLLANNLANASAAGFKSDQASYGLYVSPEAADSPEGTNPAILPVDPKSLDRLHPGRTRSNRQFHGFSSER